MKTLRLMPLLLVSSAIACTSSSDGDDVEMTGSSTSETGETSATTSSGSTTWSVPDVTDSGETSTSGLEPDDDEGSSDGETPSGSGEETGPVGGSTGVAADVPSYEEDVRPIFWQRCSCHATNMGQGGFNIGPHAYMLSYQSRWTTLPMVDPGNPSRSFLITKLGGETVIDTGDIMGVVMPNGTNGLASTDPDQFDVVYRWIEGGAPE